MFAASKSGSVEAKDPQFNYVTMLLHGNGTNGTQNNTFTDSSTNNFTITRNGNTTQGTFSPYGSNWSNYFSSGNSLSTASSSAFNCAGDFTLEAWIFPTSAWASAGSYNPILFVSGTGLYFGQNSAGFGLRQSSTANIISYGTSPTLNVWTHVAIVRSGTTITMYYNGTSVATATSSATFSTGTSTIANDGSYTYTGYVSNLRLVKGTAVYTGSFTPSTTPLTAITNTTFLTCQSNRFVDNSTSALALTPSGSPSVQRFSPFNATSAYTTSVIGGSGYFDGSGDYLTAPNNSAFNLGSNSFTIEAFYYTSSTSDQVIISAWNTNSFEIIYSGGTLYLQANALTPRLTTTTWPLNQWNHIVFVRSGNTYSGYLNGVRFATTTDIQSISNINAGPTIGVRQGGTSFPFNGYISNLRVVNGTAVYDPTLSTLTVPTAPLTAITNTSLLLSNTNAGILDNAEMNDLETVGNAQISTSVKKYGTGSIYLDGTGDALLALSNPQGDFGSGNFTLEGWFYQTATSNQGYFSKRANISSYSPFLVQYDANQLTAFLSTSGSSWAVTINASTNPSTNTWNHIAFVRNGSTATLYLNGTSVGSASISGSLMTNSTPVVIGAEASDANNCFNGYIDDVRITKGYARYTANFTAPTAPFPDKG